MFDPPPLPLLYSPLTFYEEGKITLFKRSHLCHNAHMLEGEREREGLHRLKKRRRNVLRKMEERKREDCFYNKLKMKDTKIELCIKTNKNVKFK